MVGWRVKWHILLAYLVKGGKVDLYLHEATTGVGSSESTATSVEPSAANLGFGVPAGPWVEERVHTQAYNIPCSYTTIGGGVGGAAAGVGLIVAVACWRVGLTVGQLQPRARHQPLSCEHSILPSLDR